MPLPSSDRVPEQTAESVNRDIQSGMEQNVRRNASRPQRIGQRLAELDHEWDIERTLEANAATLAFTGVLLAAFHDRRWLLLPGAVTAFLLQHAVQGWCPPLPVLRRLGFRTVREIETERFALKALRGDFDHLEPSLGERDGRAARVLEAVRL